MLEYAKIGLIGVLTPQANTTVEPEFAILLPPGISAINARMVSDSPELEQRLGDYLDGLAGTLRQFATAPIDAYAFACTGASYLLEPDGEERMVATLEGQCGKPFITAAQAVTDALKVLRAKRLGLVSPYPERLTAASERYWQSRGFVVDCVTAVSSNRPAPQPIYSIAADSANAALAALPDGNFDAIVLLGTGMPTLGPIAAKVDGGRPVLSSTLALAWRTAIAIAGVAPTRHNLLPWLQADGWGARLRQTTS